MALSTSAITTASFTSSPTSSVPAPISAFTTPFPQPSSCSSLLTTTVSYYSAYGTTSSSTFLLPDTSDPRYTACFAPASQFSFSPAVCPEGWPASWLAQTTPALSGAATAPSAVGSVAYVSTAYCCAPSYSMPYLSFQDDPSPSCEQAFVSTISSSGAVLVSTVTLSVAMLPAWHISWQTTDMPTLSPQPPALNDNQRYTQWVPGSKPEREPEDNWGVGMSRGLFYFLVVGLPLLVVAIIAACLTACCSRANNTRSRRITGGGGAPQESGSSATAS